MGKIVMETIVNNPIEVVEVQGTSPSTLPAAIQQPVQQAVTVDAFNDVASFEFAQRTAKMLAASSIVPKDYQNNVPNCLIAMNMAKRVGADPIAVMQNLDIIHGRPAWNSKFCIGVLSQCGRFTDLRFVMSGTGDDLGCHIETTRTSNGELLKGSRVTVKMAKAEGWWTRKDSKWPNMTEQMLKYRAAAFFSRLYASDLLLGMQTVEEAQDIAAAKSVSAKADELEKLLNNQTGA